MSCGKCSLRDCARTTECPPGTYFAYRDGEFIRVVELPKDVEKAVSTAVLKALDI